MFERFWSTTERIVVVSVSTDLKSESVMRRNGQKTQFAVPGVTASHRCKLLQVHLIPDAN